MKHRKLDTRPRRHILTLGPPGPGVAPDAIPFHLSNARPWPGRMYAIAFDLDTAILEAAYPGPSWRNAYEDIRRILGAHHFDRQQGSVYFGDTERVDPVRCVLAVQDLTRQCAWFAAAVSDIRMLRIEENNDLQPAIDEMSAAVAAAATTPAGT